MENYEFRKNKKGNELKNKNDSENNKIEEKNEFKKNFHTFKFFENEKVVMISSVHCIY